MSRLGTSRSPGVRTALVVLLGLWLALLAPGSASAHATLLSSTPGNGQVLESAPKSADLVFDEPVQLVAVRIVSPGGAPEQLSGTTSDHTVHIPLPALSDGSHALSYRIVSQDGHPISGAITFQVGQSSGPAASVDELPTPGSTEAAVGVLTGLQYLGLLLLVGLVFYARFVVGPARATSLVEADDQTLTGSSPDERLQELGRGIRIRVLRLAAAMAVGSAVLLIPVLGLRVAGVELSEIAHPSQWLGHVGLEPLISGALILIGTIGVIALEPRTTNPGSKLGTQRPGRGAHTPQRLHQHHLGNANRGRGRPHLLQLVAGVMALSAPVLVGHTMSREPRWAMVLADLGHLGAGAFWSGGLAGLLITLVSAGLLSHRRDPALADPAARLVARFSRFALWAVALLALSGAVMAILVLRTPTALVHTNYGWLLVAKLGIVLVTVLVAAYNRFALLPQIRRHPPNRRWMNLLVTLVIETCLLLNVVVLTGLLTNANPDLPAPTAPVSAPKTVDVTSQDLTVRGRITPGRQGENQFTFTLLFHKQPARPQPVIVKATLPAQQLGPFVTVPTPDGAGTYHTQLQLTTPGQWQIEVSARIDDFTQPIAILKVQVD